MSWSAATTVWIRYMREIVGRARENSPTVPALCTCIIFALPLMRCRDGICYVDASAGHGSSPTVRRTLCRRTHGSGGALKQYTQLPKHTLQTCICYGNGAEVVMVTYHRRILGTCRWFVIVQETVAIIILGSFHKEQPSHTLAGE